MSYDIYGNPLRRGHCEAHPHVHEEYPCSMCVAESRWQQEAQIPAQCDGNPAHCESAHYLGQAQEEIKRLNDEIQALRKDAETERAIQRAAEVLPRDWQIAIEVEQGSGYVNLYFQGDEIEFGEPSVGIADRIKDAISAAMEQQK